MTVIVSVYSADSGTGCMATDLAATDDEGDHRVLLRTKTLCLSSDVCVAFAGNPAAITACRSLKVKPPRSQAEFEEWVADVMLPRTTRHLKNVLAKDEWAAVVLTPFGTAAMSGGCVTYATPIAHTNLWFVTEGSGARAASSFIEGLAAAHTELGPLPLTDEFIASQAVRHACAVVPTCYGYTKVCV